MHQIGSAVGELKTRRRCVVFQTSLLFSGFIITTLEFYWAWAAQGLLIEVNELFAFWRAIKSTLFCFKSSWWEATLAAGNKASGKWLPIFFATRFFWNGVGFWLVANFIRRMQLTGAVHCTQNYCAVLQHYKEQIKKLLRPLKWVQRLLKPEVAWVLSLEFRKFRSLQNVNKNKNKRDETATRHT